MVTEKEFLVQMQNYQLFQFGLCSMELVQLNSVHAENPYMCYVLFLNTNSEAYFVKLWLVVHIVLDNVAIWF